MNQKYINLTLDSFDGPNGEKLFNATVDTFVDVLKLYASISLSLPKSGNDKNEVFKTTLDLCKIHNGIRGNFIVSMILEHFNSSADYSMQCPMKAGVLHLYNFQVTDSFVPTYLLMSNLKFIVDYQAKAKIPNVKNLVYWYSMKLVGEVKKTQ